MSEKLPKSERIRSERRIDTLFREGRRGAVGPVKYCWAARGEVSGDEPGVAVMFSVPKKIFKRAWKRNLIKRRLKESYRQRKHALDEKAVASGRHIYIAFICTPVGTPTADHCGDKSRKSGGAEAGAVRTAAMRTKKTKAGAAAEIPDFKIIDNAVAKILEQILARS